MLLAQTFDLDASLLDIFLNYEVAGPQFLPLAVGRFIAHLSSIRDLLVLLVASTLFYRFPSFLNKKVDHRKRSDRIGPPPAQKGISAKP